MYSCANSCTCVKPTRLVSNESTSALVKINCLMISKFSGAVSVALIN